MKHHYGKISLRGEVENYIPNYFGYLKNISGIPQRNKREVWFINGGIVYDVSVYETEIVHSHIIEENGLQCVEVHFERPSKDGFDVARCTLPSYTWIKCEGFTNKDINKFEKFLHSNAHLLYKYAASGGIKIA